MGVRLGQRSILNRRAGCRRPRILEFGVQKKKFSHRAFSQLSPLYTDGYEMMHRAWSSIVEVPYCFSRSYVKFQGHTALKIVEFYPNWAFPVSNSSLNSPMAMKCCTKLETTKERCPIVFQGHPSNFKVTRDKTSPILTQIGRFRTIGRSQLSNPSDLPCLFFLDWGCIYTCKPMIRFTQTW